MRFRQINLDFHTSEHIPEVGVQFDKKQFQQALTLGHVDYINLFSKCHHGWAYHPSAANKMHPSLTFDLFGAQVEAAHEIGVNAVAYLSCGRDEKIILRHPEWLWMESPAWTPDFTTPRWHNLCMNTPYLDYLLAQIKEVCENYDIDGLFLDIVGVRKCYCAHCMRTLRAEGKTYLDEDAVLDLAERTYANYARRVRETVDSVKPGLPVFHNDGHIRHGRRDLAFMNSHLELESLPTGGWGYDHFPLSARYAQGLGMEYLGMTGKFHTTWGEFGGFKHPNALRYEVSLAAAHGAKSSVGDQLHPSGKMDLVTYRMIGTAYAELEEKEPWLDGVRPVADVALLSLESYYNRHGINNTPSDAGAARVLQEGKFLFDVVDLYSDFSPYKVLILPDEERITPDLRQKLDAFVAAGGKLLATGKSGLYKDKDEFAYDLGAQYVGTSELSPCYFVPEFEMDGIFKSSYVMFGAAECITGDTVLGWRQEPYFNRTAEHFCSHRHTPYCPEIKGPGMTQGEHGIYVAWPVFEEYAQNGHLIAKRMIEYALDRLLNGNKTLRTSLGAQGIVTLMKQGSRYINHLLYAVPVTRGKNIQIIEDIQPIYDTAVTVKLPQKINRVYLAPQMTDIPYTQAGDSVSYTVPKINCHQMVILE